VLRVLPDAEVLANPLVEEPHATVAGTGAHAAELGMRRGAAGVADALHERGVEEQRRVRRLPIALEVLAHRVDLAGREHAVVLVRVLLLHLDVDDVARVRDRHALLHDAHVHAGIAVGRLRLLVRADTDLDAAARLLPPLRQLRLLRGAVGLAQQRLVGALGVVELVHQVRERVAQAALLQEACGVLDRALHRGVAFEHLVLARREHADAHHHAAAIGLADQPFEARGDVLLQGAVAVKAVEAGVLLGPAAVAALHVDEDRVDAVCRPGVERAHVALGHRRAAERVAAAHAPQVDLVAAEERTVAADLELARRRRVDASALRSEQRRQGEHGRKGGQVHGAAQKRCVTPSANTRLAGAPGKMPRAVRGSK
jgi:hypothetical protein